MNKFLVLSDNKYSIIDADNINDAKQNLNQLLNKKNKVFQVINLTNAKKKFFISK
jgi:hypothetical protein